MLHKNVFSCVFCFLLATSKGFVFFASLLLLNMLIAMMAKSKSTDQVERYCYISDSTGECLEVVRIDDDNEMPRKIWIKVGKLPEETMAWAVGSEILDPDIGKCQTTLQEYCDLGCKDPAIGGAKEIPLPGPSPERRGC